MIPEYLKEILTALVLCFASASLVCADEPANEKQDESSTGIAVHVGKIFTCAGDPIGDGTILIKDGKLSLIHI